MRACVLLLACVLALLCTVTVGSPATASLQTPLATPSARRPDALRTVEFRLTDRGALNFHAYSSGARGGARSHLYTFADSVTVGAVLASQLVRELLADRLDGASATCQLRRGGTTPAVSEAARMAAVLAQQTPQHELLLECVDASVLQDGRVERWRFVRFVKQELRPNEVRAANHLASCEQSGCQKQYPLDSSELIADSWSGVWGWVESWAKFHYGELHPFPTYEDSPQTGRWHLNTGAVLQRDDPFGAESDEPVRVAITADWGAGTREADYCQQVMMDSNGTAFEPHWTMHVGDVYYVGDPDAIKANCLGIAPEGVKQGVTWPHGSLGSFAVQGNHEMYSRGYGFFDTFLPTLGVKDLKTGKSMGQGAGYASLENAYWRVILLDTGYTTYSLLPKLDNHNNTQPQAVLDWLINEVQLGNESDTRGILFLTHHQVQSAFGKPYDATPNQLASLLPPNRTVLWLWGHEHKVAFYKQMTLPNVANPVHLHGRCIGNSGFPTEIEETPARARESGLLAFDDRVYELQTGIFNAKVGYNGFVRLTLDKRVASLTYSTLATDPDTGMLSNRLQTDLVQELFQVDEAGNVQLDEFNIVNPDLTVISNH